MAISTGDVIDKFGIKDDVSAASTSALVDGTFSGSGDAAPWTNDDDTRDVYFEFNGAFATAPDAGGALHVHARYIDVDGTNDEPPPDGNFRPHEVAIIPLSDQTAEQFIVVPALLPNAQSSQIYEFYLENDAGQTLSAGWDLQITPKTVGNS